VGRLETGEVFDSSEGTDPLEFVVGAGEVIEGLEKGILGMTTGESRTVTIESAEAYGDRDEGLVARVPRSSLPPEAEVGDQLIASNGEHQFPVLVVELTESEGVLDRNHPLAGLTLVFDVTLVSVQGEPPKAPSRLILP
jgi:peptidylprolyl isomerase